MTIINDKKITCDFNECGQKITSLVDVVKRREQKETGLRTFVTRHYHPDCFVTVRTREKEGGS